MRPGYLSRYVLYFKYKCSRGRATRAVSALECVVFLFRIRSFTARSQFACALSHGLTCATKHADNTQATRGTVHAQRESGGREEAREQRARGSGQYSVATALPAAGS